MNQSRPSYSPSDDAIDTAAAAWLCERDEGFAPGRAEAFAAWRAADPRHDDAVRRTESALALIAELPAVRTELAERLAASALRPAARVPWWRGFRPPAWAAGLAAALVLAGGVWRWQAARAGEPQRFAAAAAHQEQIALQDGSVVNLNGGSEVNVRLGARERRVTLAAGERVAIPRGRPAGPAKIEQVSADALRAATSWHSPVITFYDLPLSVVVAQFNRRNVLQLVVADAALNDRRIAGTLPADKVEAFVRLLEQDGDIVAERRGAGEIVLCRAP